MSSDVSASKRRSLGGWALILVPHFWLLVFFLAPFLIVFKNFLVRGGDCHSNPIFRLSI